MITDQDDYSTKLTPNQLKSVLVDSKTAKYTALLHQLERQFNVDVHCFYKHFEDWIQNHRAILVHRLAKNFVTGIFFTYIRWLLTDKKSPQITQKELGKFTKTSLHTFNQTKVILLTHDFFSESFMEIALKCSLEVVQMFEAEFDVDIQDQYPHFQHWFQFQFDLIVNGRYLSHVKKSSAFNLYILLQYRLET